MLILDSDDDTAIDQNRAEESAVVCQAGHSDEVLAASAGSRFLTEVVPDKVPVVADKAFERWVRRLEDWTKANGGSVLPTHSCPGEGAKLASFLSRMQQAIRNGSLSTRRWRQLARIPTVGARLQHWEQARTAAVAARSSSAEHEIAIAAAVRMARTPAVCARLQFRAGLQNVVACQTDCSGQLLAALQNTTFPLQSRPNTQVKKKTLPRGLSLGANKSFGRGMLMSRSTRLHESLVRLLCRFVREEKPDFAFTSIQVNKNYASALHIDSGNLGPSLIIALGAYTGGELYVHGVGKVDIQNRWHEFDGNVPHLTCPFEGMRYSLIYFTNQSYGLVSTIDVARQHELGFNWPEPGLSKADYGMKRSRLLAASSALPPELAAHVCPGSLIKTRKRPRSSVAVQTPSKVETSAIFEGWVRKLEGWMEANAGCDLPSARSTGEGAQLASFLGRMSQAVRHGSLSTACWEQLARVRCMRTQLQIWERMRGAKVMRAAAGSRCR